MYTLQFKIPKEAVYSFIAKCEIGGYTIDFASNDLTVNLKNVRDLKYLVDILESEEFMRYE